MDIESSIAKEWFSKNTNVQIARRHGISARKVRYMFLVLSKAGIVPVGPRKHVATWLNNARRYRADKYEVKASPKEKLFRTMVTRRHDPLLKRLIAVHGSEDRFARDTSATGK